MAKIVLNGNVVEMGSAGSSAIVSFDNTMTTNEEGITGVANPMRGILTQAEYDALPEDQKSKGTYVISDGGESGGGSGVTFIPSVSEDGTLSWTNDGGLENPPPVNIKGTAGKDGSDGLTVEESTSTSGNGTWHIRKHSNGYLELALHAEETCGITRQYGTNNSAFIPPTGTRFRYSYPGIGKPIEIYSENITVTSTSDDIISFMSCGSGNSSFTSMIYPFSFISRASETLHINIFVTGRWK